MKLEYATETRAYRHIRYVDGIGMLRYNITNLAQDVLGRMVPQVPWETGRSVDRWFFCLAGAVPRIEE